MALFMPVAGTNLEPHDQTRVYLDVNGDINITVSYELDSKDLLVSRLISSIFAPHFANERVNRPLQHYRIGCLICPTAIFAGEGAVVLSSRAAVCCTVNLVSANFISQKMYTKLFCKSQYPHKSVKLFFI